MFKDQGSLLKSVCDVGAAARGQRRLVQALGVAGGGEAEIYTLVYRTRVRYLKQAAK